MGKRRFILLLLLVPIMITGSFLRPRTVDCTTTDHTYCPETVITSIERLKQSSFLLAPLQYESVNQEAKHAEPALVTLKFQRTPTGVLVAVAELSPVILTIQAEGKNYEVRRNGLIQSTEKEVQPLLLLAEPQQWFSSKMDRLILDEEELLLLAQLYDQYRHFSPRVTKITFSSPEKIQLSLEGKNPILVRADDAQWLDRQLAALQAFFRSSTMSEAYQELDARFSDLVVR